MVEATGCRSLTASRSEASDGGGIHRCGSVDWHRVAAARCGIVEWWNCVAASVAMREQLHEKQTLGVDRSCNVANGTAGFGLAPEKSMGFTEVPRLRFNTFRLAPAHPSWRSPCVGLGVSRAWSQGITRYSLAPSNGGVKEKDNQTYFWITTVIAVLYFLSLWSDRLGGRGDVPTQIQAQAAYAGFRAAQVASQVHSIVCKTGIFIGCLAVLWAHAFFYQTHDAIIARKNLHLIDI